MDTELKVALGSRAARAISRETHPDPELLATYHAGELAADQEKSLRDHLVWCRECVALLLGLEVIVQPESAAPPVNEVAAGRSSLRDRERPAPRRQSLHRSPRRRWIPRRMSPPLLSAIAASLLLTVLGLSTWIVQLRRTVAELSEPQINVVIRDLHLADSPRSTEGTGFNQVPAGSGPVTLILSSEQVPEYRDYLLVIEGPKGTELWRRRGLRRNRWDTFTLVLPAGFLPPGKYRLRLFGLDGERREAIETFPLRLLES